MGFRFSKRISILPGVRINLSKSGASLSVGPRGASVTMGKRGTYANVGLPGTGLSYRERIDKPAPRQRQERHYDPGPEMPAQLTARLEDDRVVILRPEGQPLEPELLPRAKSMMKDQIKAFLEEHAAERTQMLERLGQLHHDIPQQTGRVSGGGTEKPLADHYPDHQSYMDALMRWRAEQANSGPGEEALANAVLQNLGGLEWPAETNIAIQVDGGRLLLDVDLPEIEDMPDQAWKAVITRMALEPKPRSQKDVAASYLEHVCSVIVRLLGHAFATAPEITSVGISAYTQRQTATGHHDDEYVAAVEVDRAGWQTVSLAQIGQINPQQLLRHFGAAIATDTRGKLLVQQPLS